jgi:hypothetical protein
MTRSNDLRAATIDRLRQRWVEAHPGHDLDRGYTRTLTENLVPGLSEDQVEAIRREVGGGQGGELRPRLRDGLVPMHAVHSSAALAANAFGRFKLGHERHAQLAGERGFERLALERRLSIGGGCGRPNLDLVADAATTTVLVESKLTEHLRPHRLVPRDLKPPYSRVVPRLASSAWQAVYARLSREAHTGQGLPRHLDVAQLLKHYLGARRLLEDGAATAPVTLFYLYWEPTDAARYPALHAHRREIIDLAAETRDADDGVRFAHLSYLDLWAAWERQTEPAWIGEHVDRLRRRYVLALDAASS